MKINANHVDSARAARLASRHGECPEEWKKWLGKSFRPFAVAANRKDRRASKRVLRDFV